MNKYIPVFAVLLLSGCSASASTDFKDFDTDKDGFISIEEAEINDTLDSSFATLDVNSDGMLSTTEFKSYEDNGDNT